jgi:putative spermidine/putrescine transport system ATP-binding protein
VTSGTGLAVAHAFVSFGDKPGLDDVNLGVARGEHVALLGPSGVGKTSLLRAIAGLAPLLSGAVVVAGRDVTALPPEQRGVVYMHQLPSLFPHLTVLDNVAFPLDVRGVATRDARAKAMALLERVQLGFAAGRAPASLSGGQRHRVALARALAANPAVLLLDEPFAALDPALRADVREAVVDLLQHGTGPAVLFVTHDVDEAAGLADRVIVLLHGRIAQIGTPAAILSSPQSVDIARFLGLPNLVRGTRSDDGVVSCALGTFPVPGPPGRVSVIARSGSLIVRQPRGGKVTGMVRSVLDRVGGVAVLCEVAGERILAVPEAGIRPAIGDTVDVVVDASSLHVIGDRLDGD